jgi:hypothetical protein
MSLIAFPALPFGNQVIESSKITHKPLLFRLGWQSWGQGFDPPQLHQENTKRLASRPFLFQLKGSEPRGIGEGLPQCFGGNRPVSLGRIGGWPPVEARRKRFPLSSTKKTQSRHAAPRRFFIRTSNARFPASLGNDFQSLFKGQGLDQSIMATEKNSTDRFTCTSFTINTI